MTRPHAGGAAGRLIGALPRALGRIPEEEVLLIGLSEEAGSIALVLSQDLDEDPAGAADDLLTAAAEDGTRAAAVLTYSADAEDRLSPGALTAAAVLLRAPSDFRILDALWVSGERWGSYLCPDPACCPAGGLPVTTPEEHHP